MNLAIFELFPYLLRAEQNKIKGMKETRIVYEVQRQGGRRNSMGS